MGRPRTRTVRIPATVVDHIIDLFGTWRNAYEHLTVKRALSYASFYRAMRGNPVTKSQRDGIMNSWGAWKKRHLR